METIPGNEAGVARDVSDMPGSDSGSGAHIAGGAGAPEVLIVGASDAFGRVMALVGVLLTELRGLNPEGAGRRSLRGIVAALGRVRAGVDAAEARVVQALEQLDDGGVDAVEVLRRNAGSSQREARRRRRRAQALAEMPNVAGALAAGDISTEHAEALARAAEATSAAAVDGDAELLAQVAEVPADQAGRHIQEWTRRNQDPFDLHERFLRQRRRRRLNFGDGEDGMLMAHAAFDRVLGAQFRSLINGIADRIWRAEGGRDNPNSRSSEQRRLDALAIAVGLEPEPSEGAGAPDEPPAEAGVGPAGTSAAGAGPARTPTAGAGPAGTPAAETPAAGAGPAGTPAAGVAAAGANPAATAGANPARTGRKASNGSRSVVGGSSTSGRNGRGPGLPVSPRHQIVVVASADVISDQDGRGRCEIPGTGPIPQSELERLACDAELFGVLFSGEGEPLWHGRGVRTATDSQRRALLARDGGCVLCADEPARCEAHHIVPWARPTRGPTDIDNLALLCGTCHRRLHNNKRILTRSPDGTWGTAPDPRHARRANTAEPGSRANIAEPGSNGVNAAATSHTDRGNRPRQTVACAIKSGEITHRLLVTDWPAYPDSPVTEKSHRTRSALDVASLLDRSTLVSSYTRKSRRRTNLGRTLLDGSTLVSSCTAAAPHPAVPRPGAMGRDPPHQSHPTDALEAGKGDHL